MVPVSDINDLNLVYITRFIFKSAMDKNHTPSGVIIEHINFPGDYRSILVTVHPLNTMQGSHLPILRADL
jgi:hypothetical protein